MEGSVKDTTLIGRSLCLFHDLPGLKLKLIRCDKFEVDPIPESLLRQTVAGTVKMTVETLSNIILPEQGQNLLAFIALVTGRIMQKNNFLFLPCRLQRSLKAAQFPLKYFFIMLPAAILFVEPAPSTAAGSMMKKYLSGNWAALRLL